MTALVVGRVRVTDWKESEGRVARGSWWGMKRIEARLELLAVDDCGGGGGGATIGAGGALEECSPRFRVIESLLLAVMLNAGGKAVERVLKRGVMLSSAAAIAARSSVLDSLESAPRCVGIQPAVGVLVVGGIVALELAVEIDSAEGCWW
jgi:hypothetical protein